MAAPGVIGAQSKIAFHRGSGAVPLLYRVTGYAEIQQSPRIIRVKLQRELVGMNGIRKSSQLMVRSSKISVCDRRRLELCREPAKLYGSLIFRDVIGPTCRAL